MISSADATGGESSPDISLTNGGSATARSNATSRGAGNVTSSADATSGVGFFDGSTTAVANALAAGGGTAIAEATVSNPSGFQALAANVTSNAETAKGAMAQALSTAVNFAEAGETQSTAKTSFKGVSVQSTAVASALPTNAIAQGGSGQAFVNCTQAACAFSTARPDKAYAATLIDGASNVADALLGPPDRVFGTAILSGLYGSASSTFDFRFRGDLLLGLIDGSGDFSISDNGAEILSESFVDDSIINLGSNLGPDIDLTLSVTNGVGRLRRRRWHRPRTLDMGDVADRLRVPRLGGISPRKSRPRDARHLSDRLSLV